MKNILMILIGISLIFSAQEFKSKPENLEKKNFIEQSYSDDPQIQSMISGLKEDFSNERDQVNKKYSIKKETLKKQRQQELEYLRDSYKKKMQNLQDDVCNQGSVE